PVLLLSLTAVPGAAGPTYVRKDSRTATVLASLKASGLPTLEGRWYVIGPFDNADNRGFTEADPPEKETDLKKTYPGKGGETAAWKEFREFALGKVVNLKRFENNDNASVFLLHEFDSPEEVALPVSLGSDDTIKVWLNGKLVLAENVVRGAA